MLLLYLISISATITPVPDEGHSNSINVAEPFTGNWAEPTFNLDLTSILTGYFDVEVKVTDLAGNEVATSSDTNQFEIDSADTDVPVGMIVSNDIAAGITEEESKSKLTTLE